MGLALNPSVYVSVCLILLTLICVSLCVHVQRSEDSLREAVLPFHHVGPGTQTQVITPHPSPSPVLDFFVF